MMCLLQIQNHTPVEFTLVHLLKRLSELLHLLGPEMRLDDPSCSKVKGLDSFLAISNRNTNDLLRFRDQSLVIPVSYLLQISK